MRPKIKAHRSRDRLATKCAHPLRLTRDPRPYPCFSEIRKPFTCGFNITSSFVVGGYPTKRRRWARFVANGPRRGWITLKMIRFPPSSRDHFKTIPDYGARMAQANHTLQFNKSTSRLPAVLFSLLSLWSPVSDSAP